jgi:hypothetical protein
VTPASAKSPTSLDGSASSDPDGTISRYDWSFGDSRRESNAGPAPTHVYRAPGRYTVTLTVTDDAGCSTRLIFTGQTAACNGSPRAQKSKSITISPAGGRKRSAPRCKLAVRSSTLLPAAPGRVKNRPGSTLKSRATSRYVALEARCNRHVRLTLTGALTGFVGHAPGADRRRRRVFRLTTVNTTLRARVAKVLKMRVPAAAVLALEHGLQESAAFTLTGTSASGPTRSRVTIHAVRP